jgi:hypothetical protein
MIHQNYLLLIGCVVEEIIFRFIPLLFLSKKIKNFLLMSFIYTLYLIYIKQEFILIHILFYFIYTVGTLKYNHIYIIMFRFIFSIFILQ